MTRRPEHSANRFARNLAIACGVFSAIFVAEFVLEWVRLGKPGLDAVSWVGSNNAKLVDLLSPMARAYNNVLAMLLATIGLAIPLTANMHTPKLIEMFLRDRTNQVVLTLFAFGAANVLWASYSIGPKFAPIWLVRVAVAGAMVGWAALIPYFFYVVRFLDPSNILGRLKRDIVVALDGAHAPAADLEVLQDEVRERLDQIGTLLLKAIDRADRSVVREGIWNLKLVLDHYGRRKTELPAPWFKVDRHDFVGLSAEALDVLNHERTWVEQAVLTQMMLAYQGALAKSGDVISSISDAVRVVATQAASRRDERALDLAIRFFNAFLREAIKRKDIHAIYDLFYQYRVLGRDVREHGAALRRIAGSIRAYAEQAAASGLEFALQLAGFDLGWLACRAYEGRSPHAATLLDEVLALRHAPHGRVLHLLVKAKIGVGAWLLARGPREEAARVRANLGDVAEDVVSQLGHELLHTEPLFWEVTDRQVNLEWVPPEMHDHVRAFVKTSGGPATA